MTIEGNIQEKRHLIGGYIVEVDEKSFIGRLFNRALESLGRPERYRKILDNDNKNIIDTLIKPKLDIIPEGIWDLEEAEAIISRFYKYDEEDGGFYGPDLSDFKDGSESSDINYFFKVKSEVQEQFIKNGVIWPITNIKEAAKLEYPCKIKFEVDIPLEIIDEEIEKGCIYPSYIGWVTDLNPTRGYFDLDLFGIYKLSTN